MAKDVRAALARSERAEAARAELDRESLSLSVGFKKHFTPREQVDITTKRREMRARLIAAD